MKKKCPFIVNRIEVAVDTFSSEFGECIEAECAAWMVNRDRCTGSIDKRTPGRCRMFDKDGTITHTRDWE